MNKFALILLLLLITGCVTMQPRERSVSVSGMDFRPFTVLGFLMTPEKYLGEDAPTGLISVSVWPEVVRNSDRKQGVQYMRWVGQSGSSRQMRYIEIVPVEVALQEAYEAALNMGADALVDVSVRAVDRRYGPGQITGLEVSGFAINRH